MRIGRLFLLLAVAGMTTFTACSNDDELTVTESTEQARPVTLDFDFNLSAGGLKRAGRPLYSSQALQQVNDMMVYVFKENSGSYTYTGTSYDITAFDNAAATGDENHSLEIETALTDGSYKFLAVGLEDATTYSPIAFTANTTTLEAAEIQLADAQKAGEFFAGSTNVYAVNAETQSLGVSITLTRVVAGVLGYFKNVPYQLIAANGSMKRVTKVAVQLNQNANKAAFVAPGTELTFGDGSAYTELMSIAFDDQAAKDEAKNIYTCAEVTTGSEGNPAKVENSFLVGGYSLPCAALTGKATMKVVLYAGDEALKTYPVQMESSQTDFALSRNTFYGIGHKEADNNTTGEKDPDDGDEDDPNPGEEDDPIDLSKDQIITITVNANWEAIHDLGLGNAE